MTELLKPLAIPNSSIYLLGLFKYFRKNAFTFPYLSSFVIEFTIQMLDTDVCMLLHMMVTLSLLKIVQEN